MRYILDFGEVIKMSEKNWRRFLHDIANGEDVVASNYGKRVCIIDKDVSDLLDSDAAYMLEDKKDGHE